MGSHSGSLCCIARSREASSPNSKMVDADVCKKICDIYDWDGKGKLDMFYLGDIMYAMGFNTTKKVCVGLGQTDEEGKKFCKFDDILCNLGDEIPKVDVQKMFAE